MSIKTDYKKLYLSHLETISELDRIIRNLKYGFFNKGNNIKKLVRLQQKLIEDLSVIFEAEVEK